MYFFVDVASKYINRLNSIRYKSKLLVSHLKTKPSELFLIYDMLRFFEVLDQRASLHVNCLLWRIDLRSSFIFIPFRQILRPLVPFISIYLSIIYFIHPLISHTKTWFLPELFTMLYNEVRSLTSTPAASPSLELGWNFVRISLLWSC